MILRTSLFLVLALFINQNIQAQNLSATYEENTNFKFRANMEMGFLAVLNHKAQFSETGTYINYVKEGGQDVLFPVRRMSLELEINDKHIISFLYQPLRLESTTTLDRDLIIDDLVFPEGTAVDFLYDFPFYRISYMKEFLSDNEQWDFAFGGGLQLRNATINFESTDGELFRSNRDLGPVPLLKFRTRYNVNERTFTEIEADGLYAPVSYLNGSDNEVVGAILDFSIRQGLHVTEHIESYINLRYIGGGAVGTSEDDPGPGDGYVKNWLHFMTVTGGITYEF